jgi:hypothetical protein
MRGLERRLAAGCPPPGVYRVQVVVVPPGHVEPQLPDLPPCGRCGRCHDVQVVEQIVLVGSDGKELPA